MTGRNLYGILCRFPEPGKVKTRLARGIGREEAALFYRGIAETIMQNTAPQGGGYERVLFYSPEDRRDAFGQWFPRERLVPQRGGDLGAVMKHALEDLLAMGAARAVITGSDIPQLNSRIVSQAFLELEQCDIVLGPADDGGYYLIGMKTVYAALFRGKTWGSRKVFGETLDAIRDSGLTWKTVVRLSDVDTAEDLKKTAWGAAGDTRE